jgi:glutamate--cysteine ligase
MVPRLTTALKGPLLELEQRILTAQPAIEHWFRMQWQEHTPPFYSSVDLRNSGFKLAPVDTNLFPGGFNNLNPDFVPLCVLAVQSAVEKICPEARGVLLIPENHTRNQFYLQNVSQLALILRQAGFNLRIGTLLPEITESTTLDLAHGGSLTLEPLVRTGNRLGLNNRRKSGHFAAYRQVSSQFAELLGIDSWLIDPYFAVCNQVNFQEKVGEECLAAQVDAVLQQIRAKYAEYGVKQDPFVIVKADAGTYGMGIMTVKDASEVRGLNRRQRNKMAVVKEGLQVSDVLIQEGIYTFEDMNDAVAEPVVYMIDRYVVGGFYRVHTERGVDENLNAPGMRFEPLAFDACCTLPNPDCAPDDMPNRFYAYGVVARLAMLAASLELEGMTA